MNTISLRNGTEIPQLGLGLWQVQDEMECRSAVQWALEAGYRHFDTAQAYENEAFLGSALADSAIPREEIFVTTKIWNENQHWDELIPSFEESLHRLQTDYVDLLLLHFPVTELRRPAWRQMEHLANSGKVKAIGVSNYTIRHLEELLKECDIKPTVNQVELHVFLQQPELVAFCQENGIVVAAYSPLAHGYGMDDAVLQAVARKHGKSSAQIMIRWCVEQGFVVLPKSVHQDRLAENFAVYDFALDHEDRQQLGNLDKDYRTCWDPTHVG